MDGSGKSRKVGMVARWRAPLAVVLLVLSAAASAHCDSLGGPVVADGRKAIESADLAPALKWVNAESETELRDAFERALAVRKLGEDARLLADRHFFETLVRLHRAGEGEAFSGLKPADAIEPGIAAADETLRTGSPDILADRLSAAVAAGVKKRFGAAAERRAHAEESVEAGRAYARAYVEYVHFVESVERLATRGPTAAHRETEH